MLGIIAAAVAAPIAGLLGYAATRPGTFHVERSATIQAPPEAIYPHLIDFHRWADWSPYEKMDPEMKKTYGGADAGPGATYGWEGRKSGAGRMEITQAHPHSRIAIALDFTKPFRASHTAEFTLQPQGGATRVTWGMDGRNPFASKLFGVFVNLDHMIGKDFEAGLANLKALAEQHPVPPAGR